MSPHAKKRAYQAALYARRKAAGDCVECGCDAVDHGVRCEQCHAREKARQRRYRRTAKHRERKAAADVRLRKQRRAAGRCWHCGKKANGRALCAYHRTKTVAATRKWRARQKALKQAGPGWSLEADIREELLALSELTLMRKIGVQVHE